MYIATTKFNGHAIRVNSADRYERRYTSYNTYIASLISEQISSIMLTYETEKLQNKHGLYN